MQPCSGPTANKGRSRHHDLRLFVHNVSDAAPHPYIPLVENLTRFRPKDWDFAVQDLLFDFLRLAHCNRAAPWSRSVIGGDVLAQERLHAQLNFGG